MRDRLLLAVALLMLGPVVRGEEGRVETGGPVTSLSFEGNAEVDRPYLASITDLQPGLAFTEEAVRASLRRLFSTRLFSDLAVAAARDGDGVRVVVHFRSVPRVRRVVIPPGVPARGAIRGAIGISAGDLFSAERLESAERSALRVLGEKGFFEARVAAVAEPTEGHEGVDVRLEIVAGRAAVAGEPMFVGSLGSVTADWLRKAARLKVGKRYRADGARDDAARYLAALRRLGYLRAEVRFEDTELDDRRELARARYAVFVGPEVVLAVIGAPANLVRDHRESPWTNGEPIDEESLARLAVAVRRNLQEKGHARASVALRSEIEVASERHTFTIVKGGRYVVRSVEVRGVPREDLEAVRQVISTRPRGLVEPGRLVDERVASDREAILTAYRRRGFAAASAAPPVIEDGPDPFTLRVVFPVTPGPRYRVSEVLLLGAGAVPEAVLAPLLKVRPGDSFDPGAIGEDVERLRLAYSERGFVEARVEGTAEPSASSSEDLPSVTVRFVIREGQPVHFGKTVVRGNWRVRTQVVLKELSHEEGQPVTTARLTETQENISRLGVFSRVDLRLLPADPGAASRTVLVSVEESRPWSVLYGIGAEYDEREARFNLKPRLSLGVSYSDLFGRALTASVDARYTPRETRLVASLRDRSLFGRGSPLGLTAFVTSEERTYKVDRRGAYLEAEKRLSPLLKSVLRYQYELVKSDADPLVLSPSERQNQNIDISSVGPGVVWDTRPDPTDPRSGVFVSVDGKYAFPFLSANASFIKGFLAVSGYQPLGSLTAAVSLRYGAIEPFTSSCRALAGATLECLPNLQVPVVERFFAGGRSTHRAFPLDELAIEGQSKITDPERGSVILGGNGLLVANLELRIPLGSGWGASLFVDGGNVWADHRSISLRQLRWGAGLGVHYLTPVGPVRLEYGWKADRQPGESPGELSFSIGFPF